MNKVIITGNTTKDIELQKSASGTSYCRFSIANNRFTKDKEQSTTFINVIAWSGLADTISKYVKKGNKIGIVGRIETSSYTDKSGAKKYDTYIVAEDIEFLTPKQSTESGVEAQPTDLVPIPDAEQETLPF